MTDGAPVQETIADLDVRIAEKKGRLAQEKALAKQAEFERLSEGRYRLRRPGIEIEVDYLRRSGGHLKGEVLVRTWFPGVREPGSILAIEDMNLSSTRTRSSFAKYIEGRSKLKDFDWTQLVEDFCQHVLVADREGEPAVWLHSLDEPERDETWEVEGWPLLSRHPTILFGDGGTTKSYLALWAAGRLSERGKRVGIFDWELDGKEHRKRLRLLFGSRMPRIRYRRCHRPFSVEIESLRRIVRDDRLDYVILDSIGFACDGPAETHEVASRYFQALRALGEVGSLHIAHTSKNFDHADKKPFGSSFWHNGARSTWNIKAAEPLRDEPSRAVGLYNRKVNTGGLHRSIAFELSFGEDSTEIKRTPIERVGELAESLPTAERIRMALRRGNLTRQQIEEEVADLKPAAVKRMIDRLVADGKVLKFYGVDKRERFSLTDTHEE